MNNNKFKNYPSNDYWTVDNHAFSNINNNFTEQSSGKAAIPHSIPSNNSNVIFSSNFKAKTIIKQIDALAGSGKTHGAIEYALKMASAGEKVLIVQPTIKLIKESYENAKNLNISSVHISKIHSGPNKKRSTQSEIIEYLKKPTPSGIGEIFLITHKAFFNIPYFHDKINWTVIFDEVPDVTKFVNINLPDTHRLITDHIETISENAFEYKLQPKYGHEDKLQQIVKNKNKDDFYNLVRDLAEMVLSKKWDVFIKKQNWERILNRDTKNGSIKLQAFGILQPDIIFGFKEVVMMGAMFDESLLSKLWEDERIIFDDNHEIKDNLRFDCHENSNLIEIFFCFTDTDWSKRNRDKEVEYHGEKSTYMDFFVKRVKAELSQEEFIFSVNNDIEDDIFLGMNGTRLSGSPHGLNQYKHINNVVFLSALNPTPAHFTFFESKGISPSNLKEAYAYQSAYQAIMRSSIRDPKNKYKKRIYVPDLGHANWLKKYFPDATITKLSGLPEFKKPLNSGRPKQSSRLSDADRKRVQRTRHRLLKEIEDINIPQKTNLNCHNNNYSNSTLRDTSITISLFKYLKHTQPSLQTTGDFEQFAYLFKEIHKQNTKSKEENILFSPAVFNGTRSKSNFQSASILVLDIDDGDMKPDDFRKIFPDLRMLIFNTFSGNGRFRVIIPVDRKLNYEGYVLIQEMIIQEVENNGFVDNGLYSDKNKRKHGIDKSKIGPESMFYIPCQPKNPADSLFIEQNGALLNPHDWMKIPIIVKNEICNASSDGLQKANGLSSGLNDGQTQSKIQKYIEIYQSIPAGIKKRNLGFFILGLRLYNLGLPEYEIKNALIEADTDGSRAKDDQIKSVLKSLSTGRYGRRRSA